MNTLYIKFEGTLKERITAIEMFDRVCTLIYNQRPGKTYTMHDESKVVEYPDIKDKSAFYRTALQRLAHVTGYRGPKPYPVIPRSK